MPQRYQKEIEEILSRTGDRPDSKGPPLKGRRAARRPAAVGSAGPRPRERLVRERRRTFSPGRLMLAGVVLLLVALVLRGTLPGVVGPVAWAGVGLFIIAYMLFFTQPRPPVEKRWRGRPVEDRSQRRSAVQRIRGWFRPR